MAQKPKPKRREKATYKDYAKYGGMAMQFFGATIAGVFVGKWLDNYFEFSKATFAVFLAVGFMLAAMYKIFREILDEG